MIEGSSSTGRTDVSLNHGKYVQIGGVLLDFKLMVQKSIKTGTHFVLFLFI